MDTHRKKQFFLFLKRRCYQKYRLQITGNIKVHNHDWSKLKVSGDSPNSEYKDPRGNLGSRFTDKSFT